MIIYKANAVKFVNGMQSCSLSITLQSRLCAWCGWNDVGRWPAHQGTNERTAAFYHTIPTTKL